MPFIPAVLAGHRKRKIAGTGPWTGLRRMLKHRLGGWVTNYF